ncbi:MAG: dihydroorotate dehydrogenase [Desulfomonile tiedjei]|nr:dihydroorotate dehydrogenase [Desulfomonile tiedjei]
MSQDPLIRKPLANLKISSPFTIPSGVVTTVPAVLARIARDVPAIGFLTTKTLSVNPREGYREPIVHEYYPGCFVNAVGLANPGARNFVEAMQPLLPLHDNKPLLVSIMGNDPEEFLECAVILDPIADAFELNLSCPHVKGAGQSVGSDPEAVGAIMRLLTAHIKKPIIPKLSPNLGDIPGMARLCEEEGAAGLSLINTVGPGTAVDAEGNPILSNVNGGLSGAGILPVGLKAVREAASAVNILIIASGGIGSAEDVIAYSEAGASFFAVGSAMAGLTTREIADFFARLTKAMEKRPEQPSPAKCLTSESRTTYSKTRVVENTRIGDDIFKLRLEKGPACDPGKFFFLRLPGVGEKPFSPAYDLEPVYFVRKVGPFTSALEGLKPGDWIYMRGPYGKGFPAPPSDRPLVLVAGGTGSAPIIFAATRWKTSVAKAFFGFSREVTDPFREDISRDVPGATVVIDTPDRVGQVVRFLAEDMQTEPELYRQSLVLVCGPSAMMQAAVAVLEEQIPEERIFVAREDVMRCGIGLCGSCGTKSGLRSCIDGPVMPAGADLDF